GIVPAPEGGIMGVFSLATAKPIKQAGFAPQLAGLENKRRYADWQFVYRSPSATDALTAASSSTIARGR
ncbi:MAG TPA: hypothetical protein VF816_09680, partial [Rhodocyclaceae bacterium]